MSSVKRISMSLIALVILVYMCITLTSQLDVKAMDGENDYGYASEAEAAATYMNFAATYTGGGLYWPGTQDMWNAASWMGYQSESSLSGNNAFSISTKNSENSVAYAIDGIVTLGIAPDPPEMGPVNASDAANRSFAGTIHGTGGSYTRGDFGNPGYFGQYIAYGYKLSALGFDQTSMDRGNSTRMIVGTITLVVYALSSMLGQLFTFTLEVLRYVNPFYFLQGIETHGALGNLISTIGTYYSICQRVAKNAAIPILFGLALAKTMFSFNYEGHNPNMGTTIWVNFKKVVIRMFFVFVGLPVMLGAYDNVLGFMSEGIDEAGSGSTIVQATFVDFETWARRDHLAPKGTLRGGSTTIDNGVTVAEIGDDERLNVRSTCLAINGAGGSAVDSATLFQSMQSSSGASSRDSKKIILLLQSYSRGDKITAGSFGGSNPSHGSNLLHELSCDWRGYNPKVAKDPAVLDLDKSSYSDDDVEAAIADRFSGEPWSASGDRFSNMGMFNYLSSDFQRTGVIVYSADSSSSAAKPDHYSVNIVGSEYAKIVYWADAIVLMGAMAYLGFAFAISMMISNFKATFKLIPAVLIGTIGSIKSIAESIALFCAMIFNVLVTCIAYSLASEIIGAFFDIIEGPLQTIIQRVGRAMGLNEEFLKLGTIVLSIVLLVKLLIKFTQYRTAIVQAATNSMTEVVNKFLETSVKAPNVAGGGGMKSAAALGAGLALAGANGAFDGLGERLGFGSADGSGGSSSSLGGGISDTMMGDNNSENNPFGVQNDWSDENNLDQNAQDENVVDNVDEDNVAESAQDSDQYNDQTDVGGDNEETSSADTETDASQYEDSDTDGRATNLNDVAEDYVNEQGGNDADFADNMFNNGSENNNTEETINGASEGDAVSGDASSGDQYATSTENNSLTSGIEEHLDNMFGDEDVQASTASYMESMGDLMDDGQMNGSYVSSSNENNVTNKGGNSISTDKGDLEGSALPEGATQGIVTDDGQFMTTGMQQLLADANPDSPPPTGQDAIRTQDGQIITGQMTPDGGMVPGANTDYGFVPGMKADNGLTVPGMLNNDGQFVPGIQTDNGFIPGVYEQNPQGDLEFQPCVFDSNGNKTNGYVSNGNFIPTDKNGTPVQQGLSIPMGTAGLPSMPNINAGDNNIKLDNNAKNIDISKSNVNDFGKYGIDMSNRQAPVRAPGQDSASYNTQMKNYNNGQEVMKASAVNAPGHTPSTGAGQNATDNHVNGNTAGSAPGINTRPDPGFVGPVKPDSNGAGTTSYTTNTAANVPSMADRMSTVAASVAAASAVMSALEGDTKGAVTGAMMASRIGGSVKNTGGSNRDNGRGGRKINKRPDNRTSGGKF